ncbi:MAG: SWIM zinc finger family protein [Saprospiraceae bacterium]|nr:SWIM zinc finger family protein [Saprospiraceae bacterium]
MLWTTRDIAQLAPDPATLERARPLVHARRWQSPGAIDDLLWGEFRTPGDPYLVAARISAIPAFYCSCPVKRKPCKHVLALLLLAAQGSDAFTTGLEAPEWVSAWLSRMQRKRGKTSAAAPEVATSDKRLAAMQAGAADLLTWLHQQIGQGLAAAEGRHEEWDRFAARLVDAKMGSIARRLRLIHAAIGADNWPRTVLHELADLYLFARAFSQYDQLPSAMQQELLSFAGVNIRKEDLPAGENILADRWISLGRRQYAEDQLSVRRTWLVGEQSGQFALLLDFAWGNNDFEQQWPAGMALEGTMAFYPAVYPQRAVIQTFHLSDTPFQIPEGNAHFEALFDNYTGALAANPWLSAFPALIDGVVPVFHQSQWLLVDPQNRHIPLAPSEAGYWPLLALSGGRPLSIFGEWNGASLLPISAVADQRIVALS